MGEIVVVGDVHEGMNFPYNIDPETGLSARALDIHKNLRLAAEYALESRASLFVIVGDLFDRTHVSPISRELVRRDVIEPLGKAGVEVWILAGNHDQPHNSGRETSLEDFRGYPHVKVFRKPAVQGLEIDGIRVECILLPYMHPEQIAALVKEKEGREIPQEQLFVMGQKILQSWLEKKASGTKADFKLLFAHYYLEGARLREGAYPEVLPGEFSLRKEMIPETLDLAVFGHVHIHQVAGRRGKAEIVYTGSVERLDWGEKGDRKGFITIDPASKAWRFVELPCREMLRIEVEIGPGEDPLERILEAIPAVDGALVRLEVGLSEGQRERVEDRQIVERLKGAFHYEVSWRERSGVKKGIANFTMDPFSLFHGFVELNYPDHPRREDLLEKGRAILREVVG